MTFDWIAVAAQVLNFLILLWILNRLVYRPLSRAMEAREARIRDGFRRAEAAERAAKEEAASLAAERADIESRRKALLEAARSDAEDLSDRLTQEAREEAARLRRDWAERLEAEGAEFLAEMRRRTGDRLTALARRALSDLASEPLEAAIANAFAARLAALPADTAEALRKAAAHDGTAVIESASPLGPAPRAVLCDAARTLLGDGVALEIAENPELICGVRVRARGQSVQLSLDGWLDRFEEELRVALHDLAPAQADAA